MRSGAFSYLKYFALNAFFRAQVVIRKYEDIKTLSLTCEGIKAPVSTCRWIGYHTYVSSKAVPGANCLSRALTAMFVLRSKGFHAQMRVGVKPEGRSFLAHAFVYSGDEIVVGDENGEAAEFMFLAAMQNASK